MGGRRILRGRAPIISTRPMAAAVRATAVGVGEGGWKLEEENPPRTNYARAGARGKNPAARAGLHAASDQSEAVRAEGGESCPRVDC